VGSSPNQIKPKTIKLLLSGSDGFTSEFLKFFWKDLKVFVIGSLNYGY